MALPSKIRDVLSFYSLCGIEDCDSLTPADVLIVPGVGPRTLDKIRLMLAYRNRSLVKDQCADYWIHCLGSVGNETETPVDTCPFTILVDTNETYPFQFDSVFGENGLPIAVTTRTVPLYTQGMADYTILGMESDIQIERKAGDLEGSLGGNRERFEEEIARLDGMCEYAAIVIEKQWSDLLKMESRHGASVKSISRTWISWSIRYPSVHWFWCAGRDHAEQVAFRILERFYWHKTYRESKCRFQKRLDEALKKPV